jgi:signal transduction histidine kinase
LNLRKAAGGAGFAAGAAAWPLVAHAAAANAAGAGSNGAGAGALLLAVAVGGAIALGAAMGFQRWRERSSSRMLRQALAASSVCWWQTDADGKITSIDTGLFAADIPFDRLRRRPLIELAIGATARDSLRASLAAGRAFRDVAAGFSEAPGPWVLCGAPVRDGAGSLLGFAGALQRASAPTAGNQSTLQSDLDDRTRQLVDRTRELDNAVRELDSFAYSVSHDLRAPLRVVDGFATIVLEDYGDRGKPLDDLGRDHLRRIVAASQRMNTMIDTLLGLSKMTSRELNRERVDLSQIARELADDLLAQSGGRTVDFVIAPNLRADGDSTLLRLVLQNLLGNAYKFTSKSRDARVEFGARADGNTTAFFVKDNGAGFDMRFAEKMFGLFQRLHSANEFPGTGVGLATVQKIVRRHGGRVWAEAVPAPADGHGATFYFTLWETAPAQRDH